FLAVAKATLGLLKHLDKGSTWAIGAVSHNSPLSFEFVGQSPSSTQAIIAMMDGIDSLESRGDRPSRFDDRALNYAKVISKPLSNGLSTVLFETEYRKPVRVTSKLYSQAAKAQGPDHYYAFTELEGILEMIKVHQDKGEFAIYDILTGKLTTCHFSVEKPEELGALITHKIRVFGKARYNKNHEPTSIAIEEYESLDAKLSIS